EKLMQFWYFGDFGAFEYNLKESDKYLVEAKTLFDYQQYLLAYNALKKSDDYFLKIKPTINKAQRSGKSIVNEQKTFSEAAQKHIEVLSKLESDVPATVVWQPEKQAATNLDLKTAIETSIKIRKNNL
ncbi:MAG TPA: hypothetical protein VLF68_02530, partial [Candidatus Saccharimonadales bacterium]|nr:hypothetical protein [Candidatus Saccharimonadales bacterium]